MDTLRVHYFDLFNLAPVGYLTISGGLVLEANLTAANMLGYTQSELIGQRISRFILKDDQDIYYLHCRRFAVTCAPQESELRMKRKDSTFFWAQMRTTILEGPPANLKQADEFAPVSRLVLSDISERKRLEDDLSKASRRRDETLATLADFKQGLDEHAIVAVTNPLGMIVYVNDKFCAISKYKREELLGQDHRMINSHLHPKSFFANLWRTIRRGQVWKGEIRNQAKNGTFYWVDTTIVPFLGSSGEVIQFVAIRTEITERKQAEHALQEANQRKDEFLATLAHELRNPLASIRTGAFLLEKEGHLDPEQGRIIDMITHQSTQIGLFAESCG